MKKLALILAIITVIGCVFCGCGKDEGLVGSWTTTKNDIEMTYVFKSDGTGYFNAYSGLVASEFTYKIEGDQITFHEINESYFSTDPYTYSIDGNQLSLSTDSDTLVLKKDK